MGKKSRDKGKRGERLLASFLRDEGYECRRGVQYAGGPDSPDVIGLPGIHIECKYVNRLNIHDALKQSIRDAKEDEIPVVFFKRDREDWRVTMQATDFMKIFREYDASVNVSPVDAEPVVRCGDCKYYLYSEEKCGLLDTRLHFYETDNVWTWDCFCSWGERRQE